MPEADAGPTIGNVMIIAFFLAVGAAGLLIAAVTRVLNGRIGAGVVFAVMFLVLGGMAGAFAAAA